MCRRYGALYDVDDLLEFSKSCTIQNFKDKSIKILDSLKSDEYTDKIETLKSLIIYFFQIIVVVPEKFYDLFHSTMLSIEYMCLEFKKIDITKISETKFDPSINMLHAIYINNCKYYSGRDLKDECIKLAKEKKISEVVITDFYNFLFERLYTECYHCYDYVRKNSPSCPFCLNNLICYCCEERSIATCIRCCEEFCESHRIFDYCNSCNYIMSCESGMDMN